MDGLHLVDLRIQFSAIRVVKLRSLTGDRLNNRFGTEPVRAFFQNGWILVPDADGRGLPITQWEDIWGEMHCEIEIKSHKTSEWLTIRNWRRLQKYLILLYAKAWEEENAKAHQPKAAE